VDRRRRAGEIEDLVHLHIQRKGHVVADELEAGMVVEMLDVALAAREEVVHAQDFVAGSQEAITEVRTEEAGAAGDKYTFALLVISHGGLQVGKRRMFTVATL